MKDTTISDSIKYVGVDDKTLELFESQYIVPNGMAYNSYIIKDEKTVIMDTVDRRATDEWFANIKNELSSIQGTGYFIADTEFKTDFKKLNSKGNIKFHNIDIKDTKTNNRIAKVNSIILLEIYRYNS